jgi:hypothetical protein
LSAPQNPRVAPASADSGARVSCPVLIDNLP